MKAMEVSPEGTLVKQTELWFAAGHTAAQIPHDETVGERAEFEGNLDRNVREQFAGIHKLLKNHKFMYTLYTLFLQAASAA